MKVFSTLLLGTVFLGTSYLTGVMNEISHLFQAGKEPDKSRVALVVASAKAPGRQSDVSDVVTKALAFKASLTSAQQSTLQLTYTTTLARKWSNLPCGSGCRNGIQLGTLTATQLGLALEVIKAATSTASNEGYDEFYQIRLADYVLSHQYSGGSGYDSTIYFLAFLNTPTASGQWMLQYGGHHYASNIGFNGGKVVGPTPQFRGVEPSSFTVNGTAYAPLNGELTAMQTMLASFTTAQLTTAKNASTFSDCVMVPGETNGGASSFPAKAGIVGSALTPAQQALVLAAMEPYLQDLDDASAASLRTVYGGDINSTYVTWTGSGTSGNASSFLIANTNYVRIDGPSVWIEFVCQNGVVISNQIHYHTVFRDHVRDYGADLTLTALPVLLLDFAVKTQANIRFVTWHTADESNINHYEVERSNNAAGGFTSFVKVVAKNSAANSYSFEDNTNLAEPITYYRLKIIAVDGSVRYSNVVPVKGSNTNTFVIYPNPTKNKIILIALKAVYNATVQITNTAGQTVLSTSGQTGPQITIDVSGLSRGSYCVQIWEEGIKSSATFLKQ